MLLPTTSPGKMAPRLTSLADDQFCCSTTRALSADPGDLHNLDYVRFSQMLDGSSMLCGVCATRCTRPRLVARLMHSGVGARPFPLERE